MIIKIMVLIRRFSTRIQLWALVTLAAAALYTAQTSTGVHAQANSYRPDEALLKQLTDDPAIAALSLSSDGHYLSALVRREGEENGLAVWRSSGSVEAAEHLPYTRPDINWLAWVGGGRLLISLTQNGLVLYDAHTGRLRPLIDPMLDQAGPRPDQLPPVLLSTLPDETANILLQWEDPAVPGYPAVYKVDAVRGVSQKILGAWRPIIRWWASPSGVVEMGEGYRGRKQLLFGRRAGGEWAEVTERDYFTGPAHTLLSIEPGGATAAVLALKGGNTRSLWRMDTRTGEFLTKLAAHKKYDISAALFDPVSGNVVGASHVEDSFVRSYWRPDFEEDLDSVAAKLGVEHVSLASASLDGKVRLYRSRTNWRPIRYFIRGAASHDGKGEQASDDIHEVTFGDPTDAGNEQLDWPRPDTRGVWIPLKGRRKRSLGPMHALLSTPEFGPTGKAIVLVHGGPVRRVNDTYSAMVSWLTANGYTVLRPNFRGSAGFGEKWRRAGYAQWGADMQDDVRTAAEWLIDAGFSEKKSMCVMGGSYGGYAALLSAINDDDLFSCAISLNGVTSVYNLVEYLKTRRFHLLTVPRIQGRLSNRSLVRRSPLYRSDLVRLPVLLLHATEDLNVPYNQGVMMAEALRRNDKEHMFIVLEGAEHQLKRARDRRTYFKASAEFLAKHLGPALHPN